MQHKRGPVIQSFPIAASKSVIVLLQLEGAYGTTRADKQIFVPVGIAAQVASSNHPTLPVGPE